MVNSDMKVINILTEGLFDYAGLFPPAGLAMEAATKEFNHLVNSSSAELMQRFVCPVGWLDQFAQCWKAVSDEPAPISVLGSSSEGLGQDLLLIEKFLKDHQDIADIESYEVKINSLDHVSKASVKKLRDLGIERIYYEVAWGEPMVEHIHKIASTEFAAAKARTGGLEPAAFPISTALAEFIHESVSIDLDFKLTAGLHHALPFHEANGSRHHGLLNVLIATAFIVSEDFTVAEAATILDIENVNQLVKSNKEIGLGEFVIDSELAESCRSFFDAVGSCSVDETVGFLSELGLSPI